MKNKSVLIIFLVFCISLALALFVFLQVNPGKPEKNNKELIRESKSSKEGADKDLMNNFYGGNNNNSEVMSLNGVIRDVGDGFVVVEEIFAGNNNVGFGTGLSESNAENEEAGKEEKQEQKKSWKIHVNKDTQFYKISLNQNEETNKEDEEASIDFNMGMGNGSGHEFEKIDGNSLEKGDDITATVKKREFKEDKLIANIIHVKESSYQE